mgnify:CR=1 FL=1|jgi:transcription elongation factor GreA
MVEDKQYLTEKKYSELKQELDFLITKKRNEIARQLESARALGDLSENAEYQEARQEQGKVENRIKYLVTLLKKAEIVKARHGNTVEVGSTVVIQKVSESEKKEYTVVGSEEADTASGYISSHAPLGRALLGKSKGETFSFTIPSGKIVEYTILKIS